MGFYTTRILLGVLSAAAMPGIRHVFFALYDGLIINLLLVLYSYLITRYYRRHELTYRLGIFMLLATGGAGGCMSSPINFEISDRCAEHSQLVGS
jgi:hypothetical protein